MNTSLDIIIIALSRSDGPYSSTAFSLAKEMAKTNRVFYVDNPFTIKDFFYELGDKQIRRRLGALLFRNKIFQNLDTDDRKLTVATPPLMIPINFLPEGKIYDFLLRVNDWLFFQMMKRMIKQFNINDFIFINVFNPFYATRFPDFFRPRMYVYYTNDAIAHSLYVQKHGVRLENKAFRSASLTFATSKELKKIASRKTDHVYYLPNGVDQSLFFDHATQLCPQEFGAIQNPIIIFTGNCDHRIDYELVKIILVKHPDKTLVLLGPLMIEDEVVNELREFPNIVLLGRRDLSELPKYVQHSQCAIIPYKCNELTKSIYPLKLNEYLASGTPVVATPFSEDIKAFDEFVMIGETPDDFCQKISEAIFEDSWEKRRSRISHAKKNIWQNRVSDFWDAVQCRMDECHSN